MNGVIFSSVLNWLLSVFHIPIVARLAQQYFKKTLYAGTVIKADLVVQNSNSAKHKEVCVKHKLTSLVMLVALVVISSGTSAQIDLSEPFTYVSLSQSDSTYLDEYRFLTDEGKISRAWRHICGRNSMEFADSNVVKEGDYILVPLGNYYTVKKTDGKDHMWRAAECFVANIVNPYLNGTLFVPDNVTLFIPSLDQPSVPADSGSAYPWWYWLIAGLFILGIALFAWYLTRDKQKTDDSAKEAAAQLERDRKFIPDPPDFKTTSTDEANRNAEIAGQSAFGRDVTIIGDIERGYINGEQKMFNADGSSSKQTFTNEPGYRATVRFPDGSERQVVCRWGCFNPCWSATDAEFKGTFKPENSSTAEEIPVIEPDQVTALEQSISGGDNKLSADDVPETDVSKSVEPVEEAADDAGADGTMRFTRVQISTDKGINLEGEGIRLTVDNLHNLVYQITGRRPGDEEDKKEDASS